MTFDTQTLPVEAPSSMITGFRSRVIAVSSGKGGVGKTNLTINLGLSLAQRGLRVAIFDADMGTANVDVVLGLQPRYHLHHVVTGQKRLTEIIVEGPCGLRVIPGASGLPDLANLPQTQREMLLRALLALDGMVDLLLIDTGAGVGSSVTQFILAAGELLLVTTPEPTAITDAYALIKILAGYQLPVSMNLVINNVRQRGEDKLISQNLTKVTERFLGRRIEMVGAVPYDTSVSEAVKNQWPLLLSYPYSPASNAINRLGKRLWIGEEPSASSIAHFFKRILSFGKMTASA